MLSRSNHSSQQATLQHTLCFSRSGLSQRRSFGIQFKYCLKVTKPRRDFCLNSNWIPVLTKFEKRSLRIKSFYSVLKLLKYSKLFKYARFLQKYHNSPPQKYFTDNIRSKLQTTICPFTIVLHRNRLVHRRYLVKSNCVTSLIALVNYYCSQTGCGPVISSKWPCREPVQP